MLVPTPTGELRCQAYIWCYPIGFLPSDKLGKTLRDVHKPVPGYEKRLAGSMDRYFGGLKAGRVVRRSNVGLLSSSVPSLSSVIGCLLRLR